MNSSIQSTPGLPTRLLNDGWWLSQEDNKPTAVILLFPERRKDRAKGNKNSDEIAVHSSQQQADLP
jgi:hypothetical protein